VPLARADTYFRPTRLTYGWNQALCIGAFALSVGVSACGPWSARAQTLSVPAALALCARHAGPADSVTVRGYVRVSPLGFNGPGTQEGLFARRSVPVFAADSLVQISQYGGLGFAVINTAPWARGLPPIQNDTYLAVTGRLECKEFSSILPAAITVVRRG
jgi:hypothetical protein